MNTGEDMGSTRANEHRPATEGKAVVTSEPGSVAPSNLEAALSYAEKGFHIFPIRPGKKEPLTPNGFKAATRDPEKIRQWWGASPGAGIGVWCGASDLVVVDIDHRNRGDKTLQDLQSKFGTIDSPVKQVTGSRDGSRHLLFAACAGAKYPGKLGEGIDVQSGGKYIILPPSMHPSGGTYEWIPGCGIGDAPLPLAPAWMQRSENPLPMLGAPQDEPAALDVAELIEIRDALKAITHLADDYHQWIAVGMSLQSTGHAEAFEMWENWSRTSEKFREGECPVKWKSFKQKENGVGIGTVFRFASQSGWRPSNQRFGVWLESDVSNELPEPRGLWSGNSPFAPPPKDAFPKGIWDLAKSYSDEAAHDHAPYLWGLMSGAMAAIPLRCTVLVSPSHEQFPIYWTMVVGEPGCGKSPARLKGLRPLERIVAEEASKAAQDHAIWEVQNDQARLTPATYQQWKIDNPEPKRDICLIHDTTAEALADAIANCASKVAWCPDEAALLVGAEGRYNNGDAGPFRAFKLICWSGGSFETTRLGRKAPRVENAACDMHGGIQPDKMLPLVMSEDDGYLPRFLLFVCDPNRAFTESIGSVDKEMEDRFEQTVRLLRAQPRQQYRYSPEVMASAKEVKRNVLSASRGSSEKIRYHLHKWDGLLARLALFMHLFEFCWSNATDTFFEDEVQPAPFEIDLPTFSRALALLKWETGMHNALLIDAQLKHSPLVKGVALYLAESDKTEVSRRDLDTHVAAWRDKKKYTERDRQDCLVCLHDAGWILAGLSRSGSNGGRIELPIKDICNAKAWRVNRKVGKFRGAANEERQRRNRLQNLLGTGVEREAA